MTATREPLVDIVADLHNEDETGLVWTWLDRARDTSVVRPGAVLTAGDSDVAVFAQVVDLVEEDQGTVVHLRVLPGTADEYAAAVARTYATS